MATPGTDQRARSTAAAGGPRRRKLPRKRIVLVVVLLVLGWLGDSVGRALTAPGTDTVAARLAEWGRFHHVGGLVTELERLQYSLHPPRRGGQVAGGVPVIVHSTLPRRGPAPVAPQASPALPHEGQWQTLVSAHGQPALRAAFLRPDAVHTSYLTGVVRFDQRLVRFVLHPGTEVPGGPRWPIPPTVPLGDRGALLATFNSGFTMSDSRGGFREGSRQVGTLRPGAAALVIYRDGHANVVQWGRDATLSPDMVAVRQNLDLLVDGGKVVPQVSVNDTTKWGYTLGNRNFVWRSALGVTADGALVYVAGASLSTKSVADIVRAAGAVRAMELDINPEWTSFMSYTHPTPASAVPHLLTPDEQGSPRRYLHTSTRDFIAVTGRI